MASFVNYKREASHDITIHKSESAVKAIVRASFHQLLAMQNNRANSMNIEILYYIVEITACYNTAKT